MTGSSTPRCLWGLLLSCLFALQALAQSETPAAGARVGQSPHNLSTSGQGAYRSLTVRQICVFCHAPHSTKPNAPLWNREDSGQSYVQYSSPTLDAVPGQPEGSSRLCLACHDGTIALERMSHLPAEAVGRVSDKRLQGRGNLGTDLGDDHPISFRYDGALANRSGNLHHPEDVDLPLEEGMLRCGTCHDPHDNSMQPFLRMETVDGTLCTECHAEQGLTWDWESSAHAVSSDRPRGPSPWIERKPQWRGATVAENACFNCHTPHSAATPQHLVVDIEEQTCFRCHDGGLSESDVKAEFLKPSRHPVNITPNPDHEAGVLENLYAGSLHAECSDCHNPHAAGSGEPMITVQDARSAVAGTSAPRISPVVAGVSGLDDSGSMIGEVDTQYGLCFKCHGVPGRSACGSGRCGTARTMNHTRADRTYNLRDKVDPNANPGLVSYHPIVQNNPFNNNDVPSLKTELGLNTSDTLIYCTDCHNSDESSAGSGTGAEGPHGSIYPPILADRYTLSTTFAGLGSARTEAALCFKCHDESRLQSGSTASASIHRSHEMAGTCITCHDPHGSAVGKHLLNFETSNNLVPPGDDPRITGSGAYTDPTWVETPDGGECWLSCHNSGPHQGSRYPEQPDPGAILRMRVGNTRER